MLDEHDEELNRANATGRHRPDPCPEERNRDKIFPGPARIPEWPSSPEERAVVDPVRVIAWAVSMWTGREPSIQQADWMSCLRAAESIEELLDKAGLHITDLTGKEVAEVLERFPASRWSGTVMADAYDKLRRLSSRDQG